jgi:hypothetical protein
VSFDVLLIPKFLEEADPVHGTARAGNPDHYSQGVPAGLFDNRNRITRNSRPIIDQNSMVFALRKWVGRLPMVLLDIQRGS